MAGQGNAERCNGLEQLGIDLTGTDTQRHGDEKLSPDQKRKGTDTLEKKRCDVLCNTETSNTRKSKETALN